MAERNDDVNTFYFETAHGKVNEKRGASIVNKHVTFHMVVCRDDDDKYAFQTIYLMDKLIYLNQFRYKCMQLAGW